MPRTILHCDMNSFTLPWNCCSIPSCAGNLWLYAVIPPPATALF